MKRGIVVGIAGAAIVAAGCVGCSSNKSENGASSSPAAPAGPSLTVDGQKQNISGAITCNPNGENVNIGIGEAANGIGAVVSNADPPIVHAVGLGAINKITFGFSDAAPNAGGNAGAKKSGKTYAIKGTATGLDASDPNSPKTLTKPFELTVTCP